MADSIIQKIKTNDVYDTRFMQNQYQINLSLIRQDITNLTDFDSQQTPGKIYFVRNRSTIPTSAWDYSPGILFKTTATDSFYIFICINDSKIAILRKFNNVWDTTWKYLTPA